jgi:uncharacterized protein (DUF4415 family)
MTASKKKYGTDLAKLDAHVVMQEEYDEIPELTDEFFDNAEISVGGRVIRKGRPPLAMPKRLVSLRLDAAVVDGFRATGPGWQSRINAVLLDHLARNESG